MKIGAFVVWSTLFFLSVLQCGCMTAALNSDYTYDQERISGFYISSDEKTLAVMGEKHHYLFPLDPPLKYVLTRKGQFKVGAQFTAFYVLPEQRVTGKYAVRINRNELNAIQIDELIGAGFVEQKDALLLSRTIDGQFYGVKSDVNTESFQRAYTITLATKSSVPAPLKVVLTPVTVAADGMMYVGGAVLLGLFCSGQAIASETKCFSGGL